MIAIIKCYPVFSPSNTRGDGTGFYWKEDKWALCMWWKASHNPSTSHRDTENNFLNYDMSVKTCNIPCNNIRQTNTETTKNDIQGEFTMTTNLNMTDLEYCTYWSWGAGPVTALFLVLLWLFEDHLFENSLNCTTNTKYQTIHTLSLQNKVRTKWRYVCFFVFYVKSFLIGNRVVWPLITLHNAQYVCAYICHWKYTVKNTTTMYDYYGRWHTLLSLDQSATYCGYYFSRHM